MGIERKPKLARISPCLVAIGIALLASLYLTPAGAERRSFRQWTPLFDGKTLDSWKKTNFGGEGEGGWIAIHFAEFSKSHMSLCRIF